jgi:hypothetical protein
MAVGLVGDGDVDDPPPVHGEFQSREHFVARIAILRGLSGARSGRPLSASAGDRRPARRSGRARSVVAESVLVKHQLLIVNRSRKRSPNLRTFDRVVAACVRSSCARAG